MSQAPLRVVFASMKWDYGFPERGLSFEHTNMYDSMAAMEGVDVTHFDFMDAFKRGGHELVRKELLEVVDTVRPQLVFFVLFEHEVPKDLLAELRDRPDLVTFNWFADDHWRFDGFTKHYAPLFDACSTTALSALPKYAAIGYTNVIRTQWACNANLYKPPAAPALQHEVTFVGQPHGNRREVIDRLRGRGYAVETWGQGWESGRLDQDQMVEVFGTSRINLNLSNASVHYGPLAHKVINHGRPRRWFSATGPIGKRLGRTRGDQIKGRNFEIPGTGGFQLSGHSEDLEAYYAPDEEIVIFRNEEELAEAVGRYLVDEDRRAAIAAAGYRRTMAEHTYAHRYREIFRKVGLA